MNKMATENIASTPQGEDGKGDPFYVKDTKIFGVEVIRWAIMKDEFRPKTVGDLRQRFPHACFALNIPESTRDDDKLTLKQGDEREHVINLPPLYKLVPMMDRLNPRWRDMVPEEQRRELPQPQPAPGASAGGEGRADGGAEKKEGYAFKDGKYQLPYFYNHLDGLPDADLFYNRVGDYSYAGCR